MGKRSSFPKIEKDFYPTPYKAVIPLLNHLPDSVRYEEPCCGEDDLIWHLGSAGHICIKKGDIITGQDALDITDTQADYFITNPPWSFNILSPLIAQLSQLAPTWLLLNADVIHNKRMAKHMRYCIKVVSVGRVSWMGNKKAGFENCAWLLFDAQKPAQTLFFSRSTESTESTVSVLNGDRAVSTESTELSIDIRCAGLTKLHRIGGFA